MSKLWISTFREIKDTFGRYLALLLIIGLGVGFFAGLKVTDPAMRIAMHKYLTENQFYDYHLISSLGFEDSDVDFMRQNIDARAIEPSISFDALVDFENTSEAVKFISKPEKINTYVLVQGNDISSDDECLVDSYVFDESVIGKSIVLSSTNSKDDVEHFKHKSYKVVGLVKSPLYIQYERGTTTLGSGVLDGFVYIRKDGFDSDVYTDCYVKLDSDYDLYSDEYDDAISNSEDAVKNALNKAADNRYNRIVGDATKELDDAKEELESSRAEGEKELADSKAKLDKAKADLDKAKQSIDEYQTQYDYLVQMGQGESLEALQLFYGLTNAKSEYDKGMKEYKSGLKKYKEGKDEFDSKMADAEEEIKDAQAEIDDIEAPSTYLLKRDSNVGYVCFESDSTIVGSIANVFPVFFFLVAALVCMTTMNRMVEDQRTQIGVLKALGYSSFSIMGKFMFYSGSAAFIGTSMGFMLGTIVFPKAIWYAYKMMYNTNELSYYFSEPMLAISFGVAFVCSIGVTFFSCRYEMAEMAASLMRPKAPKAGKRIFLEYITFIWDRLKFLKKVSLRNIFRYKGRLFMMVLGIGGCTALLVAGFGIYDSIADIAENQFSNVSKYDLDITLKNGSNDKVDVLEDLDYTKDDYILFYHTSVDLKHGKNTKNIYLNVYADDSNIDEFYDFHNDRDVPIEFKDLKDDEIIINKGLCQRFNIKLGDTVIISSDEVSPTKLKVAAINENFIYNYIYMKESSYESQIGQLPDKKNIFLNVNEDEDVHEISAKLMNDKAIAVVAPTVDLLDRIDSMMDSLNIIVYLVIGSAMALAFVVVYNLTNINISERVREIATVKVLGFYKEETRSYVFRENVILSIMGASIGLVLGKFLHAYVMSEIVVDLITFDVRVTPLSYVMSFVLTIVFTFAVNLFMGGKLDSISMTESLKAVE